MAALSREKQGVSGRVPHERALIALFELDPCVGEPSGDAVALRRVGEHDRRVP
jgi:hypothetical protein